MRLAELVGKMISQSEIRIGVMNQSNSMSLRKPKSVK